MEEAAKEMMSSVEGERREAFASVFVCTAALGTLTCDFDQKYSPGLFSQGKETFSSGQAEQG